jgi:hypothetical protein
MRSKYNNDPSTQLHAPFLILVFWRPGTACLAPLHPPRIKIQGPLSDHAQLLSVHRHAWLLTPSWERDGSEHQRPQLDKTAPTSSYIATPMGSSPQPRRRPPLPSGGSLRLLRGPLLPPLTVPSDTLLCLPSTASSNQHDILIARRQEPSSDSQWCFFRQCCFFRQTTAHKNQIQLNVLFCKTTTCSY